MYGYIPEEIAIVHGGKQKVYRGWIDLDRDKEEEEVIPAFPADPANKKKMETAVDWAKWKGTGYDRNRKANSVKVERRKNEPFDWLRILTLETRREGGRAWKVVDKDGFYFDLREDVLLDIMRHCGMGKNAEVRGKFIWAVVGSQTKIVRVGSGLHQELIEATKMHKAPTLSNKNLAPGDVCMTKSGKVGVFLGWVSGKEINVVPRWSDPQRPGYSYGRSIIGFSFSKENYKKRGLWWTDGDEKNIGTKLKKALARTKPENNYGSKSWYTYFEIKKSHVYRQRVGHIDLPDDIIEQVRQLSLRISKFQEEDARERFDSGRYHTSEPREYHIARHVFPTSSSNYWGVSGSQLSWLRPMGEPEPEVTEYDHMLGTYDLVLKKRDLWKQ